MMNLLFEISDFNLQRTYFGVLSLRDVALFCIVRALKSGKVKCEIRNSKFLPLSGGEE